jgi:hypothetical protein
MVALARLAETEFQPAPALSIVPAGAERRVFVRKEMEAKVIARRLDHTVSAKQQPRLICTLRDLSQGGLCAFSPRRMEVGERVSFSFATAA